MEPLRFSVLKQMAKSPAHAKWTMENPSPDTPAMKLGRLAHAIVLGTPVGPVWEGERRGKVWADFKAAHDGEDIVTSGEVETATAMAACLACHPEANEVLQGHREKRIHFSLAGRECRATPDVFIEGQHLTEYKTSADASPQRFPYQALRLGYTAQLAWQRFAIKADGLAVPSRVSIVAQESKPPYAVAVYGVTDDALEFGDKTWRMWFEAFRVCEDSDDWPGYPAGVLDAPDEGLQLVGADGELIEVD